MNLSNRLFSQFQLVILPLFRPSETAHDTTLVCRRGFTLCMDMRRSSLSSCPAYCSCISVSVVHVDSYRILVGITNKL